VYYWEWQVVRNNKVTRTDTQIGALINLVRIGKDAAPACNRLLRSPLPHVRRQTAKVLANYCEDDWKDLSDYWTIPLLVEVARDDDPFVVAATLESVKEVAGVDCADKNQLLKWWDQSGKYLFCSALRRTVYE
jgi:hypothetical protein